MIYYMLYIIFKTLMGTGGQPGLKQTKTKNRLPTTKNQSNLGPTGDRITFTGS